MKFFFYFVLINFVYSLPCSLRKYPDGYVCVCNSTYCDTLENVLPDEHHSIVVVSSSKAGLRFNVMKGMFSTETNNVINKFTITDYRKKHKRYDNEQSLELKATIIKIDERDKYQNITGFGGAFTGTVSYLFDLIDEPLQNHIYKSYYSLTQGIGFNMMRIPIGGCDFDLSPWAYNEYPIHDIHLSNFTKLDKRDLLKTKQINKLKEVSNNQDIKIMGSSWSSPKWMKSNNEWFGASMLLLDYYQTWADYHLKYLELMSNENINFWAITTGNEPLNGVILTSLVSFMSLGWTPKSQAKWVAENLGPTIRNSKFKGIKIFAGDDQRYTFPVWFLDMAIANNQSIDFLDGFAVHWYGDKLLAPLVLDVTHNKFPNKIILNTESCSGDRPYQKHQPILGLWDRAESYIEGIIQDLDHSVSGWIDWNLILDERGGPNYVQNYVDAPIVVNKTRKNEAYKQPIFYALGHFSKFITPGSIKIKCESPDLSTLAFLRPDNHIAVLIYNSENRPYDIILKDRTQGEILLEIPARSVHSILYRI